MQSRSSFYNKQVLTVEMLYKDANRMANISGPEQTVPYPAVSSWFSLFAIRLTCSKTMKKNHGDSVFS